MKVADCLIIVFSLTLSNINELVFAFGGTLGNIKALTDWSNEVYTNISEAHPHRESIDIAAALYISLEISSKLKPEIPSTTITIDEIVNSKGCSLMQRLPAMRQCDEALENLAMNLDVIDRFNRNLVIFLSNEGKINNATLKRWATSITSNAVGDLPDVLWKIHRSIVPGYDFHEGLFMLISRTLQENNNDLCDIGVSPQHCLYELYQTVLCKQIKAYIMTLYAYDYLRTFEDGDFNTEMKIAKNEFDATSEKLLRVVFESMKKVPRDLRRCDPKEHKRNSTFLELERLMQAYIVNKVDANYFGTCDADCSSLQRGAIRQEEYHSKSFKHNRICDGDLIRCNDGGSNLLVCQLAPLLAQGGIDNTQLEWIPIKEFYYLRSGSKESDQNRYHIWTEDDEKVEPGKHYGAINRYQRQMNLDDILLPDDYTVTGVRFRYLKGHGKSGHEPIRLEVHGTPFDYTNGKLVPTKDRRSMWFNAENMRNRYSGSYRREVKIKNPGNPLDYVNHVPNSEPNSYIKFTTTDIKKDAGQVTVPFFDALQIGGKVNFPLSGIGIFHRGYSTSGGFLAFRIYGIDLTKYMEVLDADYSESFTFRTNDEKDYF